VGKARKKVVGVKGALGLLLVWFGLITMQYSHLIGSLISFVGGVLIGMRLKELSSKIDRVEKEVMKSEHTRKNGNE